MQHIIFETIHYAHICLVRDNPAAQEIYSEAVKTGAVKGFEY